MSIEGEALISIRWASKSSVTMMSNPNTTLSRIYIVETMIVTQPVPDYTLALCGPCPSVTNSKLVICNHLFSSSLSRLSPRTIGLKAQIGRLYRIVAHQSKETQYVEASPRIRVGDSARPPGYSITCRIILYCFFKQL